MDDFEKERLLEEKRKLENMAQDSEYQNENDKNVEDENKEKENVVVILCLILTILILSNGIIFVNTSVIETEKQFIITIVQIILLALIINFRIKYPEKNIINIILATDLALVGFMVIYMALIGTFYLVLYTCFSGCQGMPG